ncbi:MAG: tyrosine-type recombinase/integrase [Pseudomonadales bacterium]
MPKIAQELSALQVRRINTDGLHFVGGVPGLALQVTGGARSWVLRVAVAGKRREIGLGGFTLTNGLAEARRKALQERERIRSGVDPVQARRTAKAELRTARLSGVTFKQAALDFITSNKAGWSSPKHAQQWENTLATYVFPLIGEMSVADISTAHVLEVLKSDGLWSKKPETASRVRQRVEKVISAADAVAGRERLNPARWDVIGKSLPAKSRVASVEHHIALPWQQVPSFMTALRTQEGVGARALEFTILTACRSGEVRGMRWSEVDFAQKLWIIPASRMKARREHRVPLSDFALEVLRDIRELVEEGEPDDLVFPGSKGPLSDMTMSAVLRRMGVDVTVHGFRSSFRDWAGESTHHPREVIEHALAHQLPDKAEAAYARGDLIAKRKVLMADWADWCAEIPAKVIPTNGVGK